MGRHPTHTKTSLTPQDYHRLKQLFVEGWSFGVAMRKIGIMPRVQILLKDDKLIEELRLAYCTPRSTQYIRNKYKVKDENKDATKKECE